MSAEKEEQKEQVTPEALTLAEKIALANRDIGGVDKNGQNSGQGGWSYITEGDIKTAVRKMLGKYKFSIIPKELQILSKTDRRTKSGGTFTFYDIQQTFEVTDGKESYISTALGTGADNGDKALNKAMTICLKNFEKQLFNISEKDDDPDGQTIPSTTSMQKNYASSNTQRAVSNVKSQADKIAKAKEFQVDYEGKKVKLYNLVRIENMDTESGKKAKEFLTGWRKQDSKNEHAYQFIKKIGG